jgi:hypothetical protein
VPGVLGHSCTPGECLVHSGVYLQGPLRILQLVVELEVLMLLCCVVNEGRLQQAGLHDSWRTPVLVSVCLQ